MHEAGEGHSHAPWALPLTRLARWRSVASDTAREIPTQAMGDITLPDIPHNSSVPRNHGENVPGANFPHPNRVAHNFFERDGIVCRNCYMPATCA